MQHRKHSSLPKNSLSLSLSRTLSSLCLCPTLSLIRFLSRCRSTCSFAKHPFTLTSILDIRFLRQQLCAQAHRLHKGENTNKFCWQQLPTTRVFAGRSSLKHLTLPDARSNITHPACDTRAPSTIIHKKCFISSCLHGYIGDFEG